MFGKFKEMGAEFLLGKNTAELLEKVKNSGVLENEIVKEVIDSYSQNKEDLEGIIKHVSNIMERANAKKRAEEEAIKNANDEAKARAEESTSDVKSTSSSDSKTTEDGNNKLEIVDYKSMSNIQLLGIIFEEIKNKGEFAGMVTINQYNSLKSTFETSTYHNGILIVTK